MLLICCDCLASPVVSIAASHAGIAGSNLTDSKFHIQFYNSILVFYTIFFTYILLCLYSMHYCTILYRYILYNTISWYTLLYRTVLYHHNMAIYKCNMVICLSNMVLHWCNMAIYQCNVVIYWCDIALYQCNMVINWYNSTEETFRKRKNLFHTL